eukprot:TRINITY_DN3354_c0_g1_i2.p1 TRINITY_DN3354_c0_g1~~TRINITY_DN3354_c0_g1_i2.p1  ORF type:complete len:1124 (+),score=286.36 TRINITY_DN3354_c0_g1_i2:51-3374(+)
MAQQQQVKRTSAISLRKAASSELRPAGAPGTRLLRGVRGLSYSLDLTVTPSRHAGSPHARTPPPRASSAGANMSIGISLSNFGGVSPPESQQPRSRLLIMTTPTFCGEQRSRSPSTTSLQQLLLGSPAPPPLNANARPTGLLRRPGTGSRSPSPCASPHERPLQPPASLASKELLLAPPGQGQQAFAVPVSSPHRPVTPKSASVSAVSSGLGGFTAGDVSIVIPRPVNVFSMYPHLRKYTPSREPNVGCMTDLRLLVVGSNAVTTICTNFLKEFGFSTVFKATNGAAALTLMDKDKSAFDLVVAHTSLSDMTGMQFVQSMRRFELMPDAPVILITTGRITPQEAELMMKSGIFDWLETPVTTQVIKVRLILHLENLWLHRTEKQYLAAVESDTRVCQQLLNQIEYNQSIMSRCVDSSQLIVTRISQLRAVLRQTRHAVALERTLQPKETCSLKDARVELASLCHQLNLLEDERQACEYLIAQVSLRQHQVQRLAAIEHGLNAQLDAVIETPTQIMVRVTQELQHAEKHSDDFEKTYKEGLAKLAQSLEYTDLTSIDTSRVTNNGKLDMLTKHYLIAHISSTAPVATLFNNSTAFLRPMELHPRRDKFAELRTRMVAEIKEKAQSANTTILDSLDFCPWDYPDQMLLVFFYKMLEGTGVLRDCNINIDVLIDFMLCVKKGYNPNPYHNFMHAIDVAQTVYHLLKLTHCDTFFTPLDKLALLIAALCHDVEHPGLNNNFHIATQSRLSLIYNDTSVLENMHASRTFRLLSLPQYNFTSALSAAEFTEFRYMVVSSILGTDMAFHFELANKFANRLKTKPFSPSSLEDRKLVAQVLVHFADIFNVCKPLECSVKWSSMLSEEFYRQGDQERKHGLEISPCMNRDSPDQAKMSLGFIDFMVHPFLNELMTMWPELQCTAANMKRVRRYWAEQGSGSIVRFQEMPPSEPPTVAPDTKLIKRRLDKPTKHLLDLFDLKTTPSSPANRPRSASSTGPHQFAALARRAARQKREEAKRAAAGLAPGTPKVNGGASSGSPSATPHSPASMSIPPIVDLTSQVSPALTAVASPGTAQHDRSERRQSALLRALRRARPKSMAARPAAAPQLHRTHRRR